MNAHLSWDDDGLLEAVVGERPRFVWALHWRGELYALGVNAVLGLALVFITGYYAWQTHRLVVEMQRDRDAEKQARRQARSEDAAYRALLALRPAARLGSGQLLTRSACEDLHAVLDSELGLLADSAVRDRVRAASLVAFTAAFPEGEFHDNDRELAMLHARMLFEATRHSLECYLTGGFLPAWGDLPPAIEAQRWLLDSSRAGEAPG